MGGQMVSHGMDAGRVRQIAVQLRLEAVRTAGVRQQGAAGARLLGAVWRGSDVQHLLARWDSVSGQLEAVADRLYRVADEAMRQADQQDDASGGTGRGPAASGGGSARPGGRGAFIGGTTPSADDLRRERALTDLLPGLGLAGPLRGGLGAGKGGLLGSGVGRSHLTGRRELGEEQTAPPETAAEKRSRDAAEPDRSTVTGTKGDTSITTDGQSITGRHEGGVGSRRQDVEVSVTPEKWSVSYEEGTELEGKGKGRFKGGLFTAEGEVATGVEIGVSAPHGTNPLDLDPRSMEDAPEGTVFTVEAGGEAEGGGGVSWRGLQTGGSHGYEYDKIAAIEKLDGDTVEITRGDRELMAGKGYVGIGAEFARIRLGGSNEHATLETESVTLDLSTPEGRAAYDEFLRTGAWPEATDDGAVSETTQLKAYDWTKGASASVKVGDLEVAHNSSVDVVNGTTQTFPDGTQQDVRVFGGADGATLEQNSWLDADGNPQPLGESHRTSYTYEFPVDATTAEIISSQTGQVVHPGETVRLTLTQAEMEAISGGTNPGQQSVDMFRGSGTYQEIQRAQAEAGMDPSTGYGSVAVVPG